MSKYTVSFWSGDSGRCVTWPALDREYRTLAEARKSLKDWYKHDSGNARLGKIEYWSVQSGVDAAEPCARIERE